MVAKTTSVPHVPMAGLRALLNSWLLKPVLLTRLSLAKFEATAKFMVTKTDPAQRRKRQIFEIPVEFIVAKTPRLSKYISLSPC